MPEPSAITASFIIPLIMPYDSRSSTSFPFQSPSGCGSKRRPGATSLQQQELKQKQAAARILDVSAQGPTMGHSLGDGVKHMAMSAYGGEADTDVAMR
jgi:hypothetical protein